MLRSGRSDTENKQGSVRNGDVSCETTRISQAKYREKAMAPVLMSPRLQNLGQQWVNKVLPTWCVVAVVVRISGHGFSLFYINRRIL